MSNKTENFEFPLELASITQIRTALGQLLPFVDANMKELLDGSVLHVGSGAPDDEAGADGDIYIDTDSNFIYGPKAAGSWGSGVYLKGSSILNGTVDPTTEGVDGDFYLNTDTLTMFGPKAAGVWPTGVLIRGNHILAGDVDPTTEGEDGDWYINPQDKKLFGPKASGVWPSAISLVWTPPVPPNPPGVPTELELIIPGNVVCEYDATLAGCYPGTGQLLTSITESPADGSPQFAHQLMLGGTSVASTDDPTFNHAPGSPSAYFSFDGGDFLAFTSDPMNFLRQMHYTDKQVAVVMAFRTGVQVSSHALFSTGAFAVSNPGINFYISSGSLYLRQAQAALGDLRILRYVMQPNKDYCLIVTWDATNPTNTLRYYLNHEIEQSFVSAGGAFVTPNAESNLLSTPGQHGLMRFSSSVAPAGTRLYSFAVINKYLSQAEASQILNMYRNRHQRGYNLP